MNKLLTAATRSWKTTTLAVLLAIDAIGHAAMALLDGDPLTNPDWTITLALVMAAFGLFFARDADKSSRDSGVKA